MNKTFLECPICHNKLIWVGKDRFYQCTKGHCYTMLKENLLNLLVRDYHGFYEQQELFAARRKMYQAGFFIPLTEEIKYMLDSCLKPASFIVDAGCGEGFFLNTTAEPSKHTYFGLDISKQAVQMAAKSYKNILWCIGSLTNMPLGNESVDVLLDIFTPANYQEFKRVLKKDGLIIKVVPGEGYLQEVREKLFLKMTHKSGVESFFSEHFELIGKKDIAYSFPCTERLVKYAIKMTPLTAVANRKVLTGSIKDLTMNAIMLVGKIKSSDT